MTQEAVSGETTNREVRNMAWSGKTATGNVKNQEIYISKKPDYSDDDLVIEEVAPASDDNVVDEVAATDESNALPKGAVRNDDGSVTLPLIKPVDLQIRDQTGKVRTQSYDSLTFHYLTGADLRAVQSAKQGEQNIVALARATRLSSAVMNKLFDKMHVADINAGGEVLAAFLATSR